MNRFRAAIAGTGFMGRTHAQALKRLDIEITGFLGITPKDGQEVGNQFKCCKSYDSFQDILADPEVDVVHICTPNHLHFEMVKSAILAGKHVYCEKPLTISTKQAEELLSIEKEHGVVGAVNYNMRFYPLIQEARQRIKTGELGLPRLVHGHYLQDWLFYETDWNWRLDAEEAGRLRAVADIGTHWFDMVTWLTHSNIVEVMADLEIFHPTRSKPKTTGETFSTSNQGEHTQIAVQTEDCAFILVKFSNNAVGSLVLSQISAGRKNQCYWEINGTKSSLSWQSESPNEMWAGYRDQPNQVIAKDPNLMHPAAQPFAVFPSGHAEGYPDTFFQAFRTYYSYLDNGDYMLEREFPTFKDGYHEAALCDAILKSHTEKSWVSV